MKEITITLNQRVADTGRAQTTAYIVEQVEGHMSAFAPDQRIQVRFCNEKHAAGHYRGYCAGRILARVIIDRPSLMRGTPAEVEQVAAGAALREAEEQGIVKREFWNDSWGDVLIPA